MTRTFRCFTLLPAAFLIAITGFSVDSAFAGEPALTPAAGTGSCSPLPPINTKKGFLANFNNPCYAVRMVTGAGGTQLGDLNATYDQMYYMIQPGYELIVVGTFPNARFMSATVYDQHLAIIGNLFDQSILPVNSSMKNPFLVGATYTPNQMYAFRVSFGFGNPVSVSPGCQTTGTNIESTVLDASQIHSGLTWADYQGTLPANMPPHKTGANFAGLVEMRKYIDTSTEGPEYVIVRRLSDGCALSAADAYQNLKIISPMLPDPTPLDQTQINAHQEFSTEVEPTLCFDNTDPINYAFWLRSRDYIPEDNGAAAGIQATVQPVRVQNMMSGLTFMRVRFKLPTTPKTPCPSGCSLTGSEQLRYLSLGFQAGNTTLYSVSDQNVVTDPDGNVTLIIGMGTPPPPAVTAANYYTYIDLSKVPNYQGLTTLFLRNMLPNPGFACSTFNVPFYTQEYISDHGFMGQYVPTVDYPTPAQIPTIPVPPAQKDDCSIATVSPHVCSLP